MENAQKDRFIITEEEAGERLDKLLAKHYPDQSRSYFQSLIERELVTLNGESVKKRHKGSIGEEVQVTFALTPEISLEAEDIPLDILYEDDDVIAVNKPAGLVVHPGPGNWSGTFVNALLHHCRGLDRQENDLRPGIVHRLDKDTSGVLIATKNSRSLQGLAEQFATREVKKEYLAICLGNPGSATVDAPIGRHPVRRKEMCVSDGGRPAITHIEVLGSDAKLSAVRLIIETGRTHQIRVHLKHRGCPILGDATYGRKQANSHYGVEHQLLHAHRLSLKHPSSGQELQLEAPLPQEIQAFMDRLVK